jgi:signal transduction histidine kinase
MTRTLQSLSSRVFLFCFLAQFLCSIALMFIFAAMGSHRIDATLQKDLETTALEGSVAAYQDGGAQELATYIAHFNRMVNGDLHLADAEGRDLVTSQDLNPSLRTTSQFMGVPKVSGSKLVLNIISPDERYELIGTINTEAADYWPAALRFFVIATTVSSLICWTIAVILFVLPLKRLSNVMENFGKGDLEIRANYNRTDEIGDVARSFDGLAARVQNLLRAQRQLFQDIAHELRSPLARMRVAVELVRSSEQNAIPAGELIKKDVIRLSDLVEELLAVVRLEQVPNSCPKVPVVLGELCGEVVSNCMLEAREKGCNVIIKSEWQGDLDGDRELLRRAVENVLRNAIRHAPPLTNIEVNIVMQKGSPDSGVVVIRDFGPGVPEELLAKIFEPFFRVENARESSTGGVGLGLAIAWRSIRAHQGDMIAENAMPGLRVRIKLPISSNSRPLEYVQPAIKVMQSSTSA